MLKRRYPKTLDELIFLNSDIFNQKYEFNLYSMLNVARTGNLASKQRVEHIMNEAEKKQKKTGRINILRQKQNELLKRIQDEKNGLSLKYSLKNRFPFILTGESITAHNDVVKRGVNPQDYKHFFSNTILDFLQKQLSENENVEDTINSFALFYLQPQFKIQIPFVRGGKVLFADYLTNSIKSITNHQDLDDEYDLGLLSDSHFDKYFEQFYDVFDIVDDIEKEKQINRIISAASKFSSDDFEIETFSEVDLDRIGKAHRTYTKVSREIMGMSLSIFLNEIYDLVKPKIKELEIKSLKKLMGLTSYDSEIINFAKLHSQGSQLTSFIGGEEGIYAPQKAQKGVCEDNPLKLFQNYIKHFHFENFNEKLPRIKAEPVNIVCNDSVKLSGLSFLRQNNLMLNDQNSFFNFFKQGKYKNLITFKKGYDLSGLSDFLREKKTNVARIEDLLVEFFTQDRKMYNDFFTLNSEFELFQDYFSDKKILTFNQVELLQNDFPVYPQLLEAIEESASDFYFQMYFSSSFYASKTWGYSTAHTIDRTFLNYLDSYDSKQSDSFDNPAFFGCPNLFRLRKLPAAEKASKVKLALKNKSDAFRKEFFEDHDENGVSHMSAYSQMVHELVLSSLQGVDHSQVTKQIGLNADVTDYAEFDLSLDMKMADKRVRRMSRPDTILFLSDGKSIDVLVLDLKLNQHLKHSRHHYIMQNLDAGYMVKKIWERCYPESNLKFRNVISGNIHTPFIGYDKKKNTKNQYSNMKFSDLHKISYDHKVFNFFDLAMRKQIDYYDQKDLLAYKASAGKKCIDCFDADQLICESMLKAYKKRLEQD